MFTPKFFTPPPVIADPPFQTFLGDGLERLEIAGNRGLPGTSKGSKAGERGVVLDIEQDSEKIG